MSQEKYLPAPVAEAAASLSASMQRLEGVLMPRLGAWLVDVVILIVFTWIMSIVIVIIGFATLGLGWMLLPVVGLVAALSYAALTIGGHHQATPGMRMAGIRVVRADGGKPDGLTAAAHALLFWVATGTGFLLALDIAIGFLRSDRRLGHDLLAGLAVVRA
ncbi:MAG: RDD family protein [Bosea sp. (in: a-proteobacteria)]